MLTTAQGYLDLGLFTEAWKTLDGLPVTVRESKEAIFSFALRSW